VILNNKIVFLLHLLALVTLFQDPSYKKFGHHIEKLPWIW